LCEIVAKGVIHNLNEGVNRVLEDYINILLLVLFNLFLQEAASTLVFGKSLGILQKTKKVGFVEILMPLKSFES
jgi:hypothetical protein